MSQLLQNRVDRGVQGRNSQAFHGIQPGESMKVSETRDSSFQVLPSTGLGGASQFLNLQTNYNNMNIGEFDDVSRTQMFISSIFFLFIDLASFSNSE